MRTWKAVVMMVYLVAAAGRAPAQQVVTTIGGLEGVQEVIVDEATNRIYASDHSGLAVIDGATNSLLAIVPAGIAPWGVALNPMTGRVYVANQVSGGVTVVDTTTLTVAGTINPFARASGVVFDAAHNRIYVSQELATLIWIIDAATDAQIGTIDTGVFRPSLMALDDARGRLYIANNSSGPLVVVDTATNAVVRSYPLPLGGHFAIDRLHGRLYFTEVETNRVDRIDLNTGDLSFFTVDPAPLSYDPLIGIGYNPNTNHLFVSRALSHNVVMLDPDSFVPLATIRSGDFGIAVNAVTNMVYACTPRSAARSCRAIRRRRGTCG
jgi:YVTN family beta-propeller protein